MDVYYNVVKHNYNFYSIQLY